MSWLFDRLADLATLDRVQVVIDVDVMRGNQKPGSIDVVDLFIRFARAPQTTVLILPRDLTEPTLPFCSRVLIELGGLELNRCRKMVEDILSVQRRHCGAVLRIQDNRVCLEPYGRLPDPDRASPHRANGTAGWMFASDDSASWREPMDRSAPLLSISIGSVSPRADVTVAEVSTFNALLDALATLREGGVLRDVGPRQATFELGAPWVGR